MNDTIYSDKPTDSQKQKRLRLEAFIHSDLLPMLLELASSIPALEPFFKNIIHIDIVLDAEIVRRELRWRLRRRKKADARTRLHEAITSGVIVAFAPTFLDAEIEKHITDIAEEACVMIADVQREWLEFRKLLHFYRPKGQHKLKESEIVDPDDLAYIAASNELGMPIYSQDRHYRQMQASVISVLIDVTAQSYARSSSVSIAIMVGSTFTATLSFEAVASVWRILKRIVQGFEELNPSIKFAIIAAVIIAFVHPKSRAKLTLIWDWVKGIVAPAVLQKITDVVFQLVEANKTANDAYERIQELLPPKRKRSALMYARVICITAKTPLPLAEIERRMRLDGYITRARNFGTYLRRVLRSSGQFEELSSGVWTIVACD